MKKNLLVTALIAFTLFQFVSAQKIDKESLGHYHYTQPPINTILVPYTTYKVVGIGANSDAYRRDIIVNKAHLAGFEKITDGTDAELTIEIEEYPIRYTEPERHVQDKSVKDKEGHVKKYKLYSVSCKAHHKYVMKISNQSGEILYKKEMSGDNSISGSQKKNPKDAMGSFHAEKNKYNKEITANRVGALMNVANNQVGFPKKDVYFKTGTVKAKKYNYDDFFSAFDLMKKGSSVVQSNEDDIDSAAVSLNEAIATFQEILKESDMENKKARVNKNITMLCYANIGLCYFYLKDYTLAAEILGKATAIDKGFTNILKIQETADDMIKRVAAFHEITASIEAEAEPIAETDANAEN